MPKNILFRACLKTYNVLWHDGPRLTELDEELSALGLAPPELGKGRNVGITGYMLGVTRCPCHRPT